MKRRNIVKDLSVPLRIGTIIVAGNNLRYHLKQVFYCLIAALLMLSQSAFAQATTYTLVIKNGHVIDPRNNINGILDVAVNDGKIASIAKNIDARGAKQVIDAKGLYVVPGLIDLHTHLFAGPKESAVLPDGFTLRSGVTTAVDAGSPGWRNFAEYKKTVIDKSKTRVLTFLNIVGGGMMGGAMEQNLADMDARATADAAKKNKDFVVGVKVAHFSGRNWAPVDRAVSAGTEADIPVMIDFGSANPTLSIEELFFNHLRPGDIFTHCFTELPGRESIVDSKAGKLKPFMANAKKRGIFFDVGYGGISFAYSQAIPALKSGFYPDAISTDLHKTSMNGSMKDMLSVMSKFLALGMDLNAVIKASASNPALIIKREDLGNLSVGSGADIALLNLREGNFGMFDYTGYKMMANKKLECEMTVKDGKIVYDLNGLAHSVSISTK